MLKETHHNCIHNRQGKNNCVALLPITIFKPTNGLVKFQIAFNVRSAANGAPLEEGSRELQNKMTIYGILFP